ncbi:MAG: hypothetical protein WBG95_05275 [Sulfitobacter sp.]
MDRIMGVATGIAVVSMGRMQAPSRLKDNFGDLLIDEGGAAAELGQQWNEGLDLIKAGNLLAGWFVGHKKNMKARDMINRGAALRQDAEKKYELLYKDKSPL